MAWRIISNALEKKRGNDNKLFILFPDSQRTMANRKRARELYKLFRDILDIED